MRSTNFIIQHKNETSLFQRTEPKEKIAEMYLGYGPIGKEFKVLCMTSSRYERLNTHQVLTLESGKKLVRRIIEYKFHFMKDDRIRHETSLQENSNIAIVVYCCNYLIYCCKNEIVRKM
ncbi:hypothetical protein YC2023_008643 [Brassica napus]